MSSRLCTTISNLQIVTYKRGNKSLAVPRTSVCSFATRFYASWPFLIFLACSGSCVFYTWHFLFFTYFFFPLFLTIISAFFCRNEEKFSSLPAPCAGREYNSIIIIKRKNRETSTFAGTFFSVHSRDSALISPSCKKEISPPPLLFSTVPKKKKVTSI